MRRYTVLKVLDRPAEQSWLVAARRGTSSQWYRSVKANPHVRMYLGSHQPGEALARPLPITTTEDDGKTPAALVRFDVTAHY